MGCCSTHMLQLISIRLFMNHLHSIYHTNYHLSFFLIAYSKFLVIAYYFSLFSFYFCYSRRRYFYAPFYSRAFWVASIFYSLFFLSSYNFFGSPSTFISSASSCLNTSTILALAFFLIHFFNYYPVLFFSTALTYSTIISFKSSLKIYRTL